MSKPKNSPDWQEALKVMSRCPVCNGEYSKEQAKLFARVESAHLVHIMCLECKSYFVAMIMMVGQGLSSVGMVTDLNYEDAVRLHRTETISVDETIEAYETIHGNTFSHTLLLHK